MTTLPPFFNFAVGPTSGEPMPSSPGSIERSVLIGSPTAGKVWSVTHAEVNIHTGNLSPPVAWGWVWGRRKEALAGVDPGGDGPVFASTKPTVPMVKNNNSAMAGTGHSTAPCGFPASNGTILTEYDELRVNFDLAADDVLTYFIIVRELEA